MGLFRKKKRWSWCPEQMEREIPSPQINYNQLQAKSAKEYLRVFKERACIKELPFLMDSVGLKPSSRLLDYGCGLGRLAYAASKFLSDDGAYYGFEPNMEALTFLKTAYAERPNFHFHGVELSVEDDYVAVAKGDRREEGVKANEIDPTEFVDSAIDVQWSCSVFTHMWTDSIINSLRSFNDMVSVEGHCVNTWLVVDDFAAYLLRCGRADRTLPFRINGALTSSEDNPLNITAYELSTVQEIYRDAGHEIVDILYGSWAGRDNGVIYQDIVISKVAASLHSKSH